MELYNRTLKAMLRSYVDDHQQTWEAYASTNTYASNSQAHRSGNTHPFHRVLNRRILEITLKSAAPPSKTLTVAKQRAGSPATFQRSLNRTLDTLQRTWEHYKSDFDRRPRKDCEWIRADVYVFSNLSDGVTKSPNLGHAVEGPFRLLKQVQHTMIIQRKELVKRIASDRGVLAHCSINVLPIQPMSASVMDLLNENS